MNGPNVAKLTGSSAPGKEEPAANGHGEGDANPFADYMWMENEEEYNRQVSSYSDTTSIQGRLNRNPVCAEHRVT